MRASYSSSYLVKSLWELYLVGAVGRPSCWLAYSIESSFRAIKSSIDMVVVAERMYLRDAPRSIVNLLEVLQRIS